MQTMTSSQKHARRRARGFATTRAARWWMLAVLLLSDVFSLVVSLGAAVAWRHFVMGGVGDLDLYWRTLPMLGTFFLLAAWQGLYSGGGNSPVRELRLLVESISLAFLLVMAATFFTQTGARFSRFIFLGAWLLAVVLLPLMRWGLRFLAASLGMWGEPLAVLGNGKRGLEVARALNQQLYLGLRPMVVISAARLGSPPRDSMSVMYKRFAQPEEVLQYLKTQGLETLIVIPEELPDGWVPMLLDTPHSHIRRVFFLSDLDGVCGVDVRAYDLNGYLGLELHQNLLNPWGRFVKRTLDIVLGGIAGSVALLPALVIAVLIKLDSAGPVLYKQYRIGKHGKPFFVWKFRTMVQDADADAVLERYLESNPALRREWAVNQKLKDDPRVTRVGRILRKFSLDELPQLINVLVGEMSLVGPRPCMPEQEELYGHVFDLYKRVRPGLTGMWQVSGRNNTTYEERVRLDEYYVRNWSIWLDIYIMIRTVWVVLSGDGAY